MIGAQSSGRNAVFSAALYLISLGALLAAPAESTSASSFSRDCGPTPSWIEGVTLPEAQAALPGCFSSRSSLAEAELSVANGRPYAQLITINGAQLDLSLSSFASSLDAKLAMLLAAPSPGGASAILLGPGERATIAIGRPPPGAARVVHVGAASQSAVAVGALAYELLSAAARHRLFAQARPDCVLAAVRGVLSGALGPERAIRRIHSCVDAADPSAGGERSLKALAYRLLRGRFFRQVVRRQAAERQPAAIGFTISPSDPNLVNAAIHLGPASFGAVPSGRRTVEHLSASGGAPPYRFYIVPEPGGATAPSWLQLASNGTLTIEPPPGAPAVSLPVEVVDSNGEHSIVPY